MTLESIYYLGQMVAVVVIVATLFAILWQGFQTNKIARADLTLSMWLQAGAMNQTLVDSPEKAAFLARMFDEKTTLTPEDRVRITFQMYTQIGVFQAAYNLHSRGLIESTAYDLSAAGLRAFLLSPVARKWWRNHRRIGYDAKFCGIIDAMVAEIDAGVIRASDNQEMSG